MSKFLNIPDGGYQIKVEEGGTITLNTGNESGEVRVTGNLTVIGNTTTVQSEDVTIRDNIIELNVDDTGTGITLERSGLKINRPNTLDMFVVFDERITWRDPITETTETGGFVLTDDAGGLVGLRTNSISTGGGDLYLINSGTGVISVTGTTNYEDQVTDDDDITNKKYVDDAIDTAFATVFLSQIGDGEDTITSITIEDEENTGVDSVINFSIDDNVVSRLYADRWEFDEVRIVGTRIETTTSNNDLILSAPGSGSVIIDDNLQLTEVPGIDDILAQPLPPTEGAKIYAATPNTGKTGIFYVNSQEVRDELISKNRSLLFSMLF